MLNWEVKENLSLLTQSKGSWVCQKKNPPFPREYWPRQLLRAIKIPNTKPARGLERFDSFHSMHYENPGFTAQDVFDDDEIQAMVPTKWIDVLEGRAEAILPPHREALIAEFAGEVKEERGRRLTKWRFLYDVNKHLTTKAFRKIEKLWETVSPSNTVMPVSFETSRRGHNGLLSKLKKPLIRTNDRSEVIAGRTGGKPPPGWKHASHKHEMVFRV